MITNKCYIQYTDTKLSSDIIIDWYGSELHLWSYTCLQKVSFLSKWLLKCSFQILEYLGKQITLLLTLPFYVSNGYSLLISECHLAKIARKQVTPNLYIKRKLKFHSQDKNWEKPSKCWKDEKMERIKDEEESGGQKALLPRLCA